MDMSIYLINPLKLDEVCRACLGKKGTMQPLYGSCLDEMMMAITNLQVHENDGLPNLLCKQCVIAISRSFAFKQMSETSEKIIRAFISEEFQAKMNEHLKSKLVDEYNNGEIFMDTDEQPEACIEIGTFDMKTELSLDNIEESYVTVDPMNGVASDVLISTDLRSGLKCDGVSDCEQEVHNEETVIINNDRVQNFKIIEFHIDGSTRVIIDKDREMQLLNSSDVMIKFKCQICGELFNSKVDLKMHAARHQEEFKCGACGKSFPAGRALRRHMKTHQAVKPHSCNVCHKTFAESSNLTKHKKRHTGELRNVQGKPHLCSVCGRSFKWATSLSKHSKYHTGNKLLSCKVCHKQYVEMRSLRIHLRSHTGEKPFECKICNKGFTQQCNLEKHLRVHTGEKPYMCPVCPKRFSQRGYVTVHMRTHTGEKPFACQICGRAFAGANTLAIHQRVHSGERPYQCETCSKVFTRQEGLQVHQHLHTGERPHVCMVCNKGFTSAGHLTGHMRSHTGEKPYICDVCNKRFAGKGSLKVHMRIHTGGKNFTCTVCGKYFTHSTLLTAHTMTQCGTVQEQIMWTTQVTEEEPQAGTSTSFHSFFKDDIVKK